MRRMLLLATIIIGCPQTVNTDYPAPTVHMATVEVNTEYAPLEVQTPYQILSCEDDICHDVTTQWNVIDGYISFSKSETQLRITWLKYDNGAAHERHIELDTADSEE